MPLIDLKTDLKSLRFGEDRFGRGSSGQPYITSKIPEGSSNLGILSKDFILRGGINAISDSATDVLRLGKMFTDLKSPSGLLFVAKQNLLSRTAVRTQTSGILNEGIYTPLSTLAQAGVNFSGYHLNKQGKNPFQLTGANADDNNNLYFNKVKINQANLSGSLENNRLFKLYKAINEDKYNVDDNGIKLNANEGNSVIVYDGGPGSNLGIGKTNIRFADQRTGIHNKKGKSIVEGTYQTKKIIRDPDKRFTKYKPLTDINVIIKDKNNKDILNSDLNNLIKFKNFVRSNPNTPLFNNITIYQKTLSSPPTLNAETNELNKEGENISPSTLSTIQLEDAKLQEEVGNGNSGGIKQDFRLELRQNLTKSQILSDGPSYIPGQNKTIDGPGGSRINYNNPANKLRNLISYEKGTGVGPVDKINALPIYKSPAVTDNDIKNDLVKFRIAVINNIDPNQKTFIHFRAYLNAISDNYTANWNPVSYLGRGEQFYTYGGFGRTVSLGWTVAAQSKEELIPMYKKLNYLVSSLAPDYSENGYMKGNLVQLTVGGYFYEQPGIITGMNLSINDDSPYEIGINNEGKSDSSVKELPMIIRVDGFSFTPIHNFRPSLQEITNPMSTINTNLTDTNGYGNQRYIALSNGLTNTNNYSNG